jgi:hypothetical protein
MHPRNTLFLFSLLVRRKRGVLIISEEKKWKVVEQKEMHAVIVY